MDNTGAIKTLQRRLDHLKGLKEEKNRTDNGFILAEISALNIALVRIKQASAIKQMITKMTPPIPGGYQLILQRMNDIEVAEEDPTIQHLGQEE